jgi:hypothetical protein
MFVLNAATGLTACDPCVCDVDGRVGVTAADALAVLEHAVGLAGDALACPPCGSSTQSAAFP